MPWDPDRYCKFKAERAQPFRDLVAMLEIKPHLKVVDLGCGTGELTAELSSILPDSNVVGIDNSSEMLTKAKLLEKPGLMFERKGIEAVSGNWDLIFSNAALHWIDDHYAFIPRLLSMLNPGGQILVQMPSNHRNRAQETVSEIAADEPFISAMQDWKWEFPVLPIDTYAEILFRHGCREITVIEKVYPHVLNSAEEVMEWLSGTTIIPYLERLPDDMHDIFKRACLEKLKIIYHSEPFLYPFRRILFSAIRP